MRKLVGVAVAAVALVGLSASPALADTTTTVNLTAVVTATGTAGITSGAGFSPASVVPGGTTTMGMGTTQPVNACRNTGTCAPGYPNWVADLTITGLQAAGLTFTGNGDTSAGCTQTNADTVVCHYPYFNNYHKSDHFDFSVSTSATPGNYVIQVYLDVHAKLPTTKAECKDGGWQNYWSAPGAPMFKNQGDCVSFVATGGRNA